MYITERDLYYLFVVFLLISIFNIITLINANYILNEFKKHLNNTDQKKEKLPEVEVKCSTKIPIQLRNKLEVHSEVRKNIPIDAILEQVKKPILEEISDNHIRIYKHINPINCTEIFDAQIDILPGDNLDED